MSPETAALVARETARAASYGLSLREMARLERSAEYRAVRAMVLFFRR